MVAVDITTCGSSNAYGARSPGNSAHFPSTSWSYTTCRSVQASCRKDGGYEKAILHDLYRKEGERFDWFITRLRLQADRCGYDLVARETVVLECAVARCKDPELQKFFFAAPQLTLLKAVEMAQHLEVTRTPLEDLNRPRRPFSEGEPSSCISLGQQPR